MHKKRKLQIDQDKQDYPKYQCPNQLQEPPQSGTSNLKNKNTEDSDQCLNPNRKRRNNSAMSKIGSIEPISNEAASLRNLLNSVRIGGPPQRQRRPSIFKNSPFNEPEREQTFNKQLDQIKKKKTQTRKIQDCKLIFQKNNILEGIIKNQKIKKLQKNFVKKIARTSTVSQPIEYDVIEDYEKDNILNYTGIQIHPIMDKLLNLLSVFQIITLLIIYSISIVFQDLINQDNALSSLQLGSLFFYLLEIILNLISMKSQAGKKVKVIKQIIAYYFKRSFWIDIVSFIILFLDISSNLSAISFLRLFIIFKLPECINKIQKLQVYFIRNIYNQQYWQLIKVFLVNFCIAHVIALFLATMVNFDSTENWMIDKNIDHAQWTQKYIWSYYWGVNIMLTVGFGDIVASNSSQAICLIFIETFSCIVMAYNINCMGGIIHNIRSENDKRSKKFKIFKKLTDQNFVPQDLQFKIENYIEQASNLKKKFNYEQDQQFINQLPQTLKISYLRQANKTVLKELVFFRDLLDKSLYNFAEHLETKISHPQEIIRAIDDDFNLMILKKGQIGYICKKNGCSLNDEIVDLIKIQKGEVPFLTSLDFLSKKRPLYQIKSLKFSVLFTLDYSRFINIFKESDMDYELFCLLRDKIRNIPDQFEVLPCQFCQKKFNHFKFTCPKLHYSPYEQHIINKQLYKQRVGKNKRIKTQRIKPDLFSPIEYYKKIKDFMSDGQTVKDSTTQMFRSSIRKQIIKSQQSNITDMSDDQIKANPTLLTPDKLQFIIDSKTKQIIQMQFLRRERKVEYQDQIWFLNLDVMTDYNSYFSQNNPNVLKERFNYENRMQRKKDRMQNQYKMWNTLGSHRQDKDNYQSNNQFDQEISKNTEEFKINID